MLQVGWISAYYGFVSTLEDGTNYVVERDKTIFEDHYRNKSYGSKLEELNHILVALQSRQEWRLASIIMQHILRLASPRSAMSDEVRSALELCATLWNAQHPGVRNQCVVIGNMLSESLESSEPALVAKLRMNNVSLLAQLAPPEFPRLQDFCPLLITMYTAAVVSEDSNTT